MCASGELLPNQTTLECAGPTCHPGTADDAICCTAAVCATYNCTEGWVKIDGTDATEQGETPETTCCEEEATDYVPIGGTTGYAGGHHHCCGGFYDMQGRAEELGRWDQVKEALRGSCDTPGLDSAAGALLISSGEVSGFNHGGEALCWDPTVSMCSAACRLMADDGCAGFDHGIHINSNPGYMCGFFQAPVPTEGTTPVNSDQFTYEHATYVPAA